MTRTDPQDRRAGPADGDDGAAGSGGEPNADQPRRRPPARRRPSARARGGRSRPAPRPDPGPLVDADTLVALDDERRFLLDSLEDLDRERAAGDMGEQDYAALHDDYTARAATVLRSIEAASRRQSPPSSGTVVVSSDPGSGRSPGNGRRRALSLIFIVGVASIAGVGVAAFSGEHLGGGTGPQDVAATSASRIAQAQRLEINGKASEALKLYDSVLKQDPANAVALTYRGWLLARAGLTDLAIASLDKAIAANPRFADAHFFRGMVLYKGRNQPADAIPEFETFLAANPPPEAVSAVQGVLDQARQDVAKAKAPAAPGG